MGIKKLVTKGFGPLNIKNQNPFTAYANAKQHGGSTLNAVLDPQGILLKKGPRTSEEAYAASKKAAAKAKKKRRDKAYRAAGRTPPVGMKKGGKVKNTNCRGMGAATSGGRYNKDG